MKFIQTGLIAALLVFVAACGQTPPEDDSVPPMSPPAGPDAAAQPAVAAAAGPGDAEAGKRLYIYCQACHSINAGGMNKVGPNLYGVIGNAAGKVEGFAYSQALLDAGLTWDDATLNAWIESPSTLVPGTTMVFAGIREAQQRADLIAYLRQASSQ